MRKLHNPFNLSFEPTLIENHSSYREGKVTVVTFENETIHMCYGVDDKGNVWDFCFLDYANNNFYYTLDLTESDDLEKAKSYALTFTP